MRLSLLEKEYQECIDTNIKIDPDQYRGLANVLFEDEKKENSSEEDDFGDFQDGYQQITSDNDSPNHSEEDDEI